MSNIRRIVLTMTLLAVAGGASMALLGCSHKQRFRLKPTPGMYTLRKTKAKATNDWYYGFNSDMRALVEDFSRFTLLDRPSRMTFGPNPY